jgi:hypothetical protein
VSLEDARSKAIQIRIGASEGHDVILELRRSERIAAAAPGSVTFRDAFDGYFVMREQQLSNGKHTAQWRATMNAYVFPTIGKRPVGEITAAEVIDILKPIWNTKRETAKRILQRMGAVFEAAIVRGERDKASPTIGVVTVLGSHKRKLEHHPAMPYADVPAFVSRLRRLQGWAATRLAFEFSNPDGVAQWRSSARNLGRDRSRCRALDGARRAHEGARCTCRPVDATRACHSA